VTSLFYGLTEDSLSINATVENVEVDEGRPVRLVNLFDEDEIDKNDKFYNYR